MPLVYRRVGRVCVVEDGQMWSGVSQVRRDGDTVWRTRTDVTPTVHAVLKHLEQAGVVGVPRVLGLTDTHERLTYQPGVVPATPLTGLAASDQVMAQVASLLRRVHDATATLAHSPGTWGLAPRQPREVICLGDVAPYNTAIQDDGAVAFFDVDTMHPGPRLWDVAYAIYRWAPLTHPDNPDGWGTPAEQRRRARLFCDAYGLSGEARRDLADTVQARLSYLCQFMRTQADAGHPAFQAHLARGDLRLYQRDIDYAKQLLEVPL